MALDIATAGIAGPGLPILVLNHPAELPLAAAAVLVPSGSLHERPGEEGYAHLLEHLAMRGGRRREKGFLFDELARRGIMSNAGTDYGFTAFFLEGLADQLVPGLALLAEVVAEPALRPGDLPSERDVVLAEFDAYESEPRELLETSLLPYLYPGHPRGRDILGDRGIVASATAADLEAFHGRAYGEALLSLLGVGAVTAADLEAVVRGVPGLRGTAGPGRPAVPPLPPYGEARFHRPLPLPACEAAWAFRTDGPAGLAGDTALEVLAAYLGRGPASPLYRRLREDLGLVYFVETESVAHGLATEFRFLWTAAARHEEAILGAFREELSRIAEAPDRKRLEAALRSRALERLQLRQQNLPTLLLMMGDLDRYGRVLAPEEHDAALAAVDEGAIAAAARLVLAGPGVCGTVGPEV